MEDPERWSWAGSEPLTVYRHKTPLTFLITRCSSARFALILAQTGMRVGLADGYTLMSGDAVIGHFNRETQQARVTST